MVDFEKAIRNKVRFQHKGILTTEDLYDLTVEDLDLMFKTLNAKKKVRNEESLLAKQTKEDSILDLQIEIVKHIVSVKLEEAEKRKQAKDKKAKREKILEILSRKEDQSLEGMSKEELLKQYNELNAE